MLGKRNTTLPRALNVASAWEIRTSIPVPSGEGFSMSRKHPPTLRSLVLALSVVSLAISVILASAIMGNRGARRRSDPIPYRLLCDQELGWYAYANPNPSLQIFQSVQASAPELPSKTSH